MGQNKTNRISLILLMQRAPKICQQFFTFNLMEQTCDEMVIPKKCSDFSFYIANFMDLTI